MRILHVYKSYYPETVGGIEKFIQNLSLVTSRLGCENRLITTTNAKKSYTNKGVSHANLRVDYYPRLCNFSSTPISPKMWKSFQEQAKWADIIHYHYPWPFADLLHLFQEGKTKPSVLTYHSDIIRQKYLKHFYSPLMRTFLHDVDAIVSNSQNYVETSSVLNAFRHKTTVIPIGLDEKSYPIVQLERKQMWKEKLPSNFILFVGVLRYYKGLEYLLQAVRNTSISVVIVGDGPLHQYLLGKAKKWHLQNVIFLGYLNEEDKCLLYQLAKLLVVPASHRSESYCITLVEGLMFGLPLISTEIGTGTSFVNEHNKTGLIVNKRDPDALREAILSILSNETMAVSMQSASLKRFESLFTANKMGQSYVELYNSLS